MKFWSIFQSDDEYENWRGLGGEPQVINFNDKPKRQRITKYMQANKDIEKSFTINRTTRSQLNSLLMNGNLTSIVSMGKKRYIVNNTCAFDSVTVIISRAYTDNNVYKEFVDKSSDTFLTFCKTVASRSTRNIYKDRLQLIKKIFNKYDEESGLNIINAECNVNWLICQLFQELPSANDHIRCSNKKCKDANKFKYYRTIILDSQDLENIKNLEKLLLEYTEDKHYTCRQLSCNGKVFSKKNLNNHIFLEMDQIEIDTNKFTMANIPQEICVNNERYI